MKEALKLSLALGLTCVVAAAVLAFAHAKTQSGRESGGKVGRQKALCRVRPEFDNEPLDDAVAVPDAAGRACRFYRARRHGTVVAYAGEGTSPRGYGGDLSVLVGLAVDGTLRSVVVTAHKETPGLGTQATDRRRRRSFWSVFQADDAPEPGPAGDAADVRPGAAQDLAPCAYLDQYAERGFKTADAPFAVRQDGGSIDAVSGATVSSRAVADAVSRVCRTFEKNRKIIRDSSGVEG